ncbi:hypothetical protein RDWZM_003546 [Blomia tropicalis]|uniref:Large ribosomal subunit protein bL21m n=1 Tax=Blomia tropicalis TaxID=40697 RepID=A0A9Q0MFL2_BLOTA|nr:39S ribosomal protein L21, mitochondrial [Blomia tropicalis]KAJ6225001.1 hypothetical protein RDWZM_003546 [Blomia tropicalis]
MCSLVRIVSRIRVPLNSNIHRLGPSLAEQLQRNVFSEKLSQRFASNQSKQFSEQQSQYPSPQPLFDKVNQEIESKNLGQTFAVVHLYGRQLLVHIGDIVSLQKSIPADIGETIKLEKCLLVGNKNFTLIGRPVLNRDLVQVEATIIEKTMTQTFFNMFHIPRKRGYRNYRFQRYPLTMLRINEITVCHPLNTTQKRIN